jgi:phosphinothricin acetyltransferase
MIRRAKSYDAGSLAGIYNYYISNTIVTFEEDIISAEEMNKRIQETESTGLPWLVAERNGEIIGYAYASKWKGRCAYRFSVEATVYLSPLAKSEGWGTRLYDELFSSLKESAIHAVIGGIALPNPASIALHEKFGMEKVAHFKEVGSKFGSWVDVGYWQVVFSD